jgi:hypothetical protein
VMYRSVLWVGVSGELPLTTPTGRCQLYATANRFDGKIRGGETMRGVN